GFRSCGVPRHPVWCVPRRAAGCAAVARRRARAARRHALDWTPLLRPFRGTHPEAARDWIAARRDARERAVGPRSFRLGHLRLYFSDWIERLTGARVFEYRNYVDV